MFRRLGLTRDATIASDRATSSEPVAAVPASFVIDRSGSSPAGERWRLEELHRHFALELAASTSLNTRGTQLAALSGVVIALLGTGAKDRVLGCWTIAVLGLAGAFLLLAAGAAVWAVYPQSQWRADLFDLIDALRQPVPAVENEVQPPAEVANSLLLMVEHQRSTNEDKGLRMRMAYAALLVGLGLSSMAIAFLLRATPAT